MSEDHVARRVHDLIVNVDELTRYAQDSKTCDQVTAEIDGLFLAEQQLQRLIIRVRPRKVA